MTRHSREILTSMVRAYIKSGQAKVYNPYYVKLETQHLVVEAQAGTRPPHFRHDLPDLGKTTPSPPPPRHYCTVPHRTIFRNSMKGPSHAHFNSV